MPNRARRPGTIRRRPHNTPACRAKSPLTMRRRARSTAPMTAIRRHNTTACRSRSPISGTTAACRRPGTRPCRRTIPAVHALPTPAGLPASWAARPYGTTRLASCGNDRRTRTFTHGASPAALLLVVQPEKSGVEKGGASRHSPSWRAWWIPPSQAPACRPATPLRTSSRTSIGRRRRMPMIPRVR